MPKLKTKSGAAKRFKKLGGGRFKRSKANLRHLLPTTNPQRKRHLRGTVTAHGSNARALRAMLPY